MKAIETAMNGKILHHQTWLNLIAAVILLAGLASAALIYHHAASGPSGAFGLRKCGWHDLSDYARGFQALSP